MCTIFVSTGKSALHWAAAVNNVEAAVVLLKNGANKDMQNNKVKKLKSSISSLSTVEKKIAEHCSAVKYVTCSFPFVCIRRKRLYSWLLGKEVMRLPRSYWTTLPTER